MQILLIIHFILDHWDIWQFYCSNTHTNVQVHKPQYDTQFINLEWYMYIVGKYQMYVFEL